MGVLRASRVVIASLCCVLGCGGLDEDQGGGLDKGQGAAHQVSSLASVGTAIGPAKTDGVCLANCAGGGSVSCSGSSCAAVDGQYVVCNGSTTYCPCTVTVSCESGGAKTCNNSSGTGPCRILGPLTNKVCGGVQCGSQSPDYCLPLPGDLECF